MLRSSVRRWLARFPGDPIADIDLLRVTAAAILLTHPLYDLAHAAIISELGRATRPVLGPLPGVMLAWAGVLAQLTASLALFFRRWTAPACAVLIVVWGAAALIFQWPAWYVVGGTAITGHPGAEFNALVIACLSAVLAWQRRGTSEAGARCGLDIVRFAAALCILLHGGHGLMQLDLAGVDGGTFP